MKIKEINLVSQFTKSTKHYPKFKEELYKQAHGLLEIKQQLSISEKEWQQLFLLIEIHALCIM